MNVAWVLCAESSELAYNVVSVKRALESRGWSVKLVDLFNLRVDEHDQIRDWITHEILSQPDLIVPSSGIRLPVERFELKERQPYGDTINWSLPHYTDEVDVFSNMESRHHINVYNHYRESHAYRAVKILDSWKSFKPHKIRDHIVASEKHYTTRKFVENEISIPRTLDFYITPHFDFSNLDHREKIKRAVGEPFIVKSVHGANGEGTEFCETVDELKDACERAWELRPGSSLILQEYISHSVGMILSVGVVGEEIYPVARVGSVHIEAFKGDTQPGRVQVAFKRSPALQKTCVNARKALNIAYCRFDGMIDGDGVFKIIECNSPGGMNIVSNTHDIEFGSVIVDHILKLREAANVS